MCAFRAPPSPPPPPPKTRTASRQHETAQPMQKTNRTAGRDAHISPLSQRHTHSSHMSHPFLPYVTTHSSQMSYPICF